MKLLLTAIGKRIELITHLKTAFTVIGTDCSELNPAKNFVDSFYLVPRYTDPDYAEALLAIVKKEQVDLLVPLYELEFPLLCTLREKLLEEGCRLVLSGADVIRICNGKAETAAFFEECHIPAPKTYQPQEILQLREEEISYPLIVKPRNGMGSEGVFRVKNRNELEFFTAYVPGAIVQECARGEEYTIDVLCDFEGHPIYIVPRIRLEVRSGEVVKSRTVRQQKVIDETASLLDALNQKGTVIGPMTVQCFYEEETDTVSFIEINPRFGGGVPLSFAAGADYASAMRAMATGEEIPYREEGFRIMTMMRYDQSVFESVGDGNEIM
ncbi:MAG: ATP-grasp domain-containing protein [Lachnospiraceae bacterium]|nr:ATP-grasp domain-containing protein [Lachnospiraceae bacterium]